MATGKKSVVIKVVCKERDQVHGGGGKKGGVGRVGIGGLRGVRDLPCSREGPKVGILCSCIRQRRERNNTCGVERKKRKKMKTYNILLGQKKMYLRGSLSGDIPQKETRDEVFLGRKRFSTEKKREMGRKSFKNKVQGRGVPC